MNGWRYDGPYEVGDKIPELVVVAAWQVAPGDIYWGTQADNPRKGWLLEAEPLPVPNGAELMGNPMSSRDAVYRIGSFGPFKPYRLVLIQPK